MIQLFLAQVTIRLDAGNDSTISSTGRLDSIEQNNDSLNDSSSTISILGTTTIKPDDLSIEEWIKIQHLKNASIQTDSLSETVLVKPFTSDNEVQAKQITKENEVQAKAFTADNEIQTELESLVNKPILSSKSVNAVPSSSVKEVQTSDDFLYDELMKIYKAGNSGQDPSKTAILIDGSVQTEKSLLSELFKEWAYNTCSTQPSPVTLNNEELEYLSNMVAPQINEWNNNVLNPSPINPIDSLANLDPQIPDLFLQIIQEMII